MLPEEKSEAVVRGLRAAFGVGEFEEIAKVTGGRTNSLVFLLKIIVRAEDPSRHYENAGRLRRRAWLRSCGLPSIRPAPTC